ncbi:MAG: hypothetical protein J3K34DRAFT_522772 [Monoraphidium minutum]|nr:MAG: hypothetical protein J3K34DRAFT_522772 [Monoraphidium minutum]
MQYHPAPRPPPSPAAKVHQTFAALLSRCLLWAGADAPARSGCPPLVLSPCVIAHDTAPAECCGAPFDPRLTAIDRPLPACPPRAHWITPRPRAPLDPAGRLPSAPQQPGGRGLAAAATRL